MVKVFTSQWCSKLDRDADWTNYFTWLKKEPSIQINTPKNGDLIAGVSWKWIKRMLLRLCHFCPVVSKMVSDFCKLSHPYFIKKIEKLMEYISLPSDWNIPSISSLERMFQTWERPQLDGASGLWFNRSWCYFYLFNSNHYTQRCKVAEYINSSTVLKCSSGVLVAYIS